MMEPIEIALVWAAAILTLSALSFLFKDNPFFKFAEHTAVGAGAAHWVVMGYGMIRDGAVKPLVQTGQLWLIIPIILGILMFGTYTKWPWLSRYPVAFLVGCGLGVAIRSAIEAQFIGQIRALVLPFVTADPLKTINNLIIVLGTIAVISYFIFAREQKGPFGKVTEVGRIIMMVYFGGAFTTIMFIYISVMLERIAFLLFQWLGLG